MVVARPVPIRVRAVLALRRDTMVAAAFAAVERALLKFLDPVAGGPADEGWPFGRAVHASDIYSVLRNVAPVDYVEGVGLSRDGTETDPVPLAADEVVVFGGVELRAYDALGDARPWPAEGS